jgi:hypothetical protein
MDKFTSKSYGRYGPEGKIQKKIIDFLRIRCWHVMNTHGNRLQAGFPDLFATHYHYGPKWIEVKRPQKYRFTSAQCYYFPKFTSHNCGIWIMTAATDQQYVKVIKGRPNWSDYIHWTHNEKPFTPIIKKRNTPEGIIQESIKTTLEDMDWLVLETFGHTYQAGFPDLFACHRTLGQRWIEVKTPKTRFNFTAAQREQFPKMCANGSGVWVLTSDNPSEYGKLFCPYNWKG